MTRRFVQCCVRVPGKLGQPRMPGSGHTHDPFVSSRGRDILEIFERDHMGINTNELPHMPL